MVVGMQVCDVVIIATVSKMSCKILQESALFSRPSYKDVVSKILEKILANFLLLTIQSSGAYRI